MIAYCERTILRIGFSLHCKSDIPKSGSLSPILGALYLTSFDHGMERWIARAIVFMYVFKMTSFLSYEKGIGLLSKVVYEEVKQRIFQGPQFLV
ncbi:MAG TPA: hypothetical protein VMW10_09860 [Alphaproteobacteria bacterium]|nr:hypothetical protein [Alphaproteobacteria bacterium]